MAVMGIDKLNVIVRDSRPKHLVLFRSRYSLIST